MKRRSFLQRLAASSVLTCFPAWGAGSAAPGWRRYSHPNLLDILDDAEAVRRIGHSYRRRYPAHDDVETLGQLLQAEAEHTGRKDPAAWVQADFKHGRVVQVEGWILSVTEARQCALYSFLSP